MMTSVVIHSSTGLPLRSRKGAVLEPDPSYNLAGHKPWQSDGSVAPGYELVEVDIDFTPRPETHRWDGAAFRDETAQERQDYKDAVAGREIEQGFDPDQLSGRERKLVLVIHRLVNLCKALADDASGSELTLDQFKTWAGNQNDISEQQVIRWIKGL